LRDSKSAPRSVFQCQAASSTLHWDLRMTARALPRLKQAQCNEMRDRLESPGIQYPFHRRTGASQEAFGCVILRDSRDSLSCESIHSLSLVRRRHNLPWIICQECNAHFLMRSWTPCHRIILSIKVASRSKRIPRQDLERFLLNRLTPLLIKIKVVHAPRANDFAIPNLFIVHPFTGS